MLDGALLLSTPRGICGLRRRVAPEEAQLFSIPLLKRKDGNFKGLIPVTHDASACTNTRRSPLARLVMFHWEFGIFSVDFFCFVVSSEAVLAWTHTWRPLEDSVGAEMKELRNMSG